MKKLVADFYEMLENTIGDPPDGVDFTFVSEVIQYDEDNSKKKKVERRLLPYYRWPKHPHESFFVIEEYIFKLENSFNFSSAYSNNFCS